jgi:uncharacterized cupredoxin-like copper-binding protein
LPSFVSPRWIRAAAALSVAGAIAVQPYAASAQQSQLGRAVVLNEFSVTPDAATAPAGSVTFNAVNNGRFGHELAVIRTGLTADQLPKVNGRVDETKVEVVGRIASVAGGANASTTLTLTAGQYMLICNFPRGTDNGHFASGMFSPLTVGAANAAAFVAAPVAAPRPAAAPAQATASPTAPRTGNAGMASTEAGTLALGAAVAVAVMATAAARLRTRGRAR